ncbi:MAG: hypothetical protein ABSH20_27995, partial [Tepidisphaeraceae bacterium]
DDVRVTAICDVNQRNIAKARERINTNYGSPDVKVYADFLRDPQNKCGMMPIKLPVSLSHTRNFVDAVKQGTRAICDIETALRSDTLCHLSLIAVKLGRKFGWDPKAEQFIGDDAANAMLQPRPIRGNWMLPKAG